MRTDTGAPLTDTRRIANIVIQIAMNDELKEGEKEEYIELMLKDFETACNEHLL